MMTDEGRRPEFFRVPPQRPKAETPEPASVEADIADPPTLADDTEEPVEVLEQTQTLARKPTWLGHYELRGELGRGGMGVVYAAYDTKLEREVAIKQLLGGRSGSRRRLVREARAMAKLSHPNVVPIYEIGERADSTFIVMEFVEGQTLRRWQETPRTQDEVLAVYKAAARGLSAAHQKKLVHRDFKPDNVMVGDDGRVRVMDFGLASVAAERVETEEEEDEFAASERSVFDPLTRPGSILGTPAYMSPEQLRAQPADAASDQFAFCFASMQALLDAIVAGELAHDEDEREPPEHVFVAHDSRDKQKVPGTGPRDSEADGTEDTTSGADPDLDRAPRHRAARPGTTSLRRDSFTSPRA